MRSSGADPSVTGNLAGGAGRLAPWLILGALGAVAFTLLPAHGGADLTLYRRMAQLALHGADPYSDGYADFPPLKMALFVILEKWHLWVVFRTLGFGALVCIALGFASGSRPVSLLAVLLLCFEPLVYRNWIDPFEDKWLYPLLLLAALMLVRAPGWATNPRRVRGVAAILWPLAAYSGATVLLLPLLLLELRRQKQS